MEAYSANTAARVEDRGISLVRVCGDQSQADTVGTINVRDRWLVVDLPTSPPGGQYQSFQPWTNANVWSVSLTADRLAFAEQPVPDNEDHAQYRLRVVSEGKWPTWERTVSYRPVPLTSKRVNEWIDGVLATEVGASFPSTTAGRKAIGERLYRPRYVPPLRGIMLAGNGGVWVRRQAIGESNDWQVFDTAGRPRATVRVPSGVVIHEARDSLVWGVEMDNLDVPTVRRYKIVR